MKIKVFSCFLTLFLIVLPFSSQADIINGIYFDIPAEWELSDSSEGDLSQNTYTYENEMFFVFVGFPSSDLSEEQTTSSSYFLDCESLFNEYDGFYLMNDISSQNESDFPTKIQDCVYSSSTWYYVFSSSVDTGFASISMFYVSPTTANHSQFETFYDFANRYISYGSAAITDSDYIDHVKDEILQHDILLTYPDDGEWSLIEIDGMMSATVTAFHEGEKCFVSAWLDPNNGIIHYLDTKYGVLIDDGVIED